MTLLPIGPGQSRAISVTGLEHVQNGFARFLPDGHSFAINGNGAGQATRCYLVDIATGKAKPASPEGITCGVFSPDGQFMTGTTNGTQQSTLCEAARRIPSRTCTLISRRSSGRTTFPCSTATISASFPARSTRRKSPAARESLEGIEARRTCRRSTGRTGHCQSRRKTIRL